MYNDHTNACIHNASMKNTRPGGAGQKTGGDGAGLVLFHGGRGSIGMICRVLWNFFSCWVTAGDYGITLANPRRPKL